MKRLLDIFIAVSGLMVLFPVYLLLMILVRILLGSPIFYKQLRPGKDGKPFRMIKFRTMTDQVGQDGELLPDELRLAHFGKFLRASSLDELPELWNVLWGDMSLVGPRPLLMEYLSLYTLDQQKRHQVKPGMTGWAQINGRNAISWEDKFRLDNWYVENYSMWLDIKILLITIKKVFARAGINSKNNLSMPKFTGK